MKQLLFVLALGAAGTLGTLVVSPLLGVGVYYLFALIRPQSLWAWSLPPGIGWSYYPAAATVLAAFLVRMGVLPVPGTRPDERPRLPAFSAGQLAVLAFGLWVGVGYLTAVNRDYAYLWADEYRKIFVMFAASAALMTTVRHVWAVYLVAAGGISFLAYEMNAAYFTAGYSVMARDGLDGMDNNILSLQIAMAVPLCLFAFEGLRHPARWLFLGLVPVLIHAVMLGNSRGAMLSLLVASPVMLLRTRHRGRMAAVAVGLVVLVPVLAGPSVRARFASISEQERDESARSRVGSWSAGLGIARDNPVFGVGVRNANLFTRAYGADMEGRTIHNQYIQIAADLGFVGLGLYTAALFLTWRGIGRARRWAVTLPEPDRARALAVLAGAEGAMAVFCVGAVFLSLDTFEVAYLMLLLAGQLAALAAAARAPAAAPVNLWRHPVPRPVGVLPLRNHRP